MFYQIKVVVIILLLLSISTGCSINHHVAEGYGNYLIKNKNDQRFPKTGISTEYEQSDKTKTHRYEFRAVTVGYANLWIVEFEKILNETLASEEVQAAFDGLSQASLGSMSENLITFNLIDYKYLDYGAHITLNIKMEHSGVEVINKDYTSSGEGQAVQMWAGGVFGMMDAIHDSTKSVIDQILAKFINDIKSIDI